MPPAISDHESGSEDDVPDQIPARVNQKATEPTQEEEEDDNEDDDEDEYRVEKIVKHDWLDDGTLVYQIKWQGYEDAGDMTWEPVENLEGAKDILQTYLKKIGGTPEPPAPKIKRGDSTRKSGGGKRSASEAFATDSPAPASSSKKRGSKGKATSKTNGTADDAAETAKRALPPGTWDNDVLRVTSIIEESVPSTTSATSLARNKSAAGKESKELIGLLEWKDGGAKTQHKMKVLRQKVPQRLLDYYEQHLVFTDAGANQTDANDKDDGEAEAEGEDVEMQ
ncbi:hypothetical protein KC343_g1120 [Hortaea werneckii]|nr:hypothetical protein KC352_g13491 [Hortaea werneckii]KAI7566296.1 hypothetical protein KC317_g5765 [Hortaea werneckii]KAI7594022.1 hypothetical protein KC346_g15722 [Hortaea werneckii]KAI7636718.1 hypothetical protein KC343_g1120 [Hortaea werneckii]KAI7671894.1 hypothetical protein KC319_g5467 [Hortaea werneckii]